MKRIFCLLMLFLSLSAVVCACDPTRQDGEETTTGSLYGTWQLDTLTIEASASVIGSGSLNTSVIDFTKTTPCYLSITEVMATARMGWDVEMATFVYDATKMKIKFNDDLSVSDDGKAMVLVGSYDITELTPARLVLRQPDFNIDIPGLFSSHQTAVYSYHRVVE